MFKTAGLMIVVTAALAAQAPGRLGPMADARRVPGVPAPVAAELHRRGCLVPQGVRSTEVINIIRGEFLRPGQTDWAALCSARGRSSILVFPAGKAEQVTELARGDDSSYLQESQPGRVEYLRAIRAVGRTTILRHWQAYGGPKPPPIDHQGIDDSFLEKASITWYFHNGRWLKLTGSD